MTTSTVCITITILVYLAGMLWIGARFAKQNESSSDFYLGGRKLGPLVTAMSAEASDMSSYLLMGLPGLAYLSGLADVGWTAIGLGLGTYLNWLFTARRIRRYTQITGAFTLPQFFSHRFHDRKHILSAISAVIIIVFFIPYTASGFSACGKLFSSLFGVDYMGAMIVSAIVIVGYTAAGGFLAASVTDLIQSIIMTIAILFVLIYATVQAGGLGAVMENAKALPGYLSFTSTYTASGAAPYNFLTIVSTLAWGLGYFGMPHILLRFMAIEDEKKLVVSRRVGSVWVVIAMFLAVMIGVVGNTLTASGTIQSLSGSASETIVIQIATLRHSGRHHVHRRLPAAGRLLQRVPEPAAGYSGPETEPEEQHAGRPAHRGAHRHSGCGHCPGPQQLHFRHCVLRLGRLRRRLRPPGHLLPLLEAHHLPRSHCRSRLRRRVCLHLEVPHQAPGRHLGHL